MVDPTSDLNEDISADEAPACESCGETILDSTEHRVITWIEDGSVEAAHFCDEDCRMAWEGES
ncbi:DUF7576 family protein [Halovenus sp. HT40]|uniref:DUF7576 family protein n=1 Tax=Halovenus sp. HT40 TaxID=3126691 RepID=UPI00300E7704